MDATEYGYHSAEAPWLESYLWPALRQILAAEDGRAKRVFEVGCGNGATASMLTQLGYEVIGIDPSKSGIRIANETYSDLQLNVGSAYDDLASEYGRFPLVVSLEVIEHCYDPRKFAKTVFDLLEDDGVAIISTPFHGYWKNFAISILGKWDTHFNPLWDHGHIKFFSEKTLQQLMLETGFRIRKMHRIGRVGFVAKSIMVVLTKREA